MWELYSLLSFSVNLKLLLKTRMQPRADMAAPPQQDPRLFLCCCSAILNGQVPSSGAGWLSSQAGEEMEPGRERHAVLL